MVSPVIDLSHHNPTPDWARIRQAGVIGVIHKATEGTSYVDNTLFSRAKAAMDAGLLWSTYHFLRPGNMTKQMDFYLKTINPVKGERICLDHEDSGVTLNDLCNAVSYLKTVRPDLQITIYSGHLIKEQVGSSNVKTLADNTSLWIAQYTSAAAPSWPKTTWPQWSLWQWTDSETIPGISAKVDGDRWNGTEEALRAWFGPAGIEPQPEPEPVPEPTPEPLVNVALMVPDGVAVAISINGVNVTI